MRIFIYFLNLVLIITSVTLLNSCKKGKDDPFFTLRSRTQRITGVWKLTNLTIDVVLREDDQSATLYQTDIFDGEHRDITIETVHPDNTKEILHDTFTYREVLRINKDGSYSKNETWIIGGLNWKYVGIWFWMGENQQLGLKDKEAVVFSITEYKAPFTNIDSNVAGLFRDETYYLQELSNKSMNAYIAYEEQDANGYYYKLDGTLSYAKQDWD